MKFKAVGLETGKVYATGSRADCFRELQKKYPSKLKSDRFYKHGRSVDKIYPETIVVTRKDDVD